MELTGAIEALAQLRGIPGSAALYTDSVYVVRGITQWIHGWRRRGWRTAEDQPVLNRDLWQRLSELVDGRGKSNPVRWLHVPGHAGVPGNERCDLIATALADGEAVDLYDGPLSAYDVDVLDTSRGKSLSATGGTSSRFGKKPERPYSYLSLVGGQLQRHQSWGECERRVKGVAGAKFKKAKSAEDERDIARSWGCPPLP
jgi:ribonuclease HI